MKDIVNWLFSLTSAQSNDSIVALRGDDFRWGESTDDRCKVEGH